MDKKIENVPEPISYDSHVILSRLKNCFEYLELFSIETTLGNYRVLYNAIRTLEVSCPSEVRDMVEERKEEFVDDLDTNLTDSEDIERLAVNYCRGWLRIVKDCLEEKSYLRRTKTKGVGHLG